MGEVASHDIVYNTTMVWNEFRAIADLLRANAGKVADQGIALGAITRATQVSKYVVQSVQTSAKTGIPYLRDYSQELQVNALDVLRSVKDLFKEGAFLGEPAIKSMESMLMDKIYPVVTKLIAAAKSIQQQAAPQSAPSAGAPATPNLRSAYYSSGYNAVSNTGSTSSPPNSARSPPSALAPPPALSAPPALSPPPMLSSPPMPGGGAAPPPLPQRDDTYHNLRTSASHTRTQPPQQLPPNSLGSSSSGSRSRYNPSGMAPPPALAPPPTLSPPPTLALPPSLHSPPIASPSAAHRPYSSAYNVAPVPSPNSGGGGSSGLGSSNSYTRGQPSAKSSNSSSNIPSLSSGGSYSRTSPPNSSYSSNYPAVSSSGGGYYPRPPLSNGSPSLPPPPALPTDLPPLPPNGLPPPPLPPGNLPPMPTDLPPLPPPGALPPMPTDLPPLPPPTEHLPIPPAMLGDEIRNQARSVVQQVMQLNQIIHEQNEEAFVEEARRTLNQLNALIARAKDFSLVQEENELRDATYEFISAAKERIGGGSSEQEFDQAVAFLADTIRLFVEAVAVAILPPPPPPREDFAKEAEDTGAEGEAKRKRLRSNVLKELLNTETTYFTQLKTLDFSFIQLIKNRKDLKTMNDPIFTSFVLCVPPIVSLSKELVGELTSRINKMSDSDQVHVGDTFVRLAPVFKMYQTYINNYDQAMAKLRQGIETEPEFDALVKQFCPPGSPDISFFFILPIQRLPRYELLLREVLKFTDKANSADEYSNLGAAILKVKESNDSINEKKRQDENMKKIIDIQNSITNEKLALLKPGRNFIREGSMEEPDASGKKGKGKSFHYFMFTDVLLKTRFERKAKNYTLVDTIWFAEVSLRDVNLSAKDLLNLFELVGSSDKFTFNCITEDEKRSWMKDMQEAIEKARAGDGSPGGRTMRTLRRGTNGEDYEGGSPRLGKKSDKKEKKSKSKRERSGTGSKLLSSLKKGD